MEGKEIEFLLHFINAGVKILSVRIAMYLTLMMTFALFMLVMWQPDYWRLGGAVAFAILVFMPIIKQDSVARKDGASTKGE
jgi:hypothetical protein